MTGGQQLKENEVGTTLRVRERIALQLQRQRYEVIPLHPPVVLQASFTQVRSCSFVKKKKKSNSIEKRNFHQFDLYISFGRYISFCILDSNSFAGIETANVAVR